jgi:hypothetical protein
VFLTIHIHNGCFFKFGVEVGVELSIVNAPYRLRIRDQLFKSYVLHEWCALNQLSNVYFDAKLKKKNTLYITVSQRILVIFLQYSFLRLICNVK